MGVGAGAVEGVAVNPGFWRGRRVLLTGHTGFKGSWLALWLQALGAELTGFSLEPPTEPSLFQVAAVGSGITSVHGDVREPEAVVSVFRRSSPEVVVHMAAQSLVRRSYRQPVETYATNVMGTVHVLEAARQVPGVKAVLVVTTDKCYENVGWEHGYIESDRLGGYDPYSSSKAAAEVVTAAMRRSFLAEAGTAVATARGGNVIGGGDWAEDRLLPDVVRAFLAGRPALIRNPGAVRPWQHVLVPLSGYLTLLEKLWERGAEFAEAWNFGPAEEDARPVSWLVDRACQLWGAGASWETDDGQHPYEAHYLKLDSAKARARLGWTAPWDLQQALALTVEWFRSYQQGRDPRALTLKQIEAYQGLLRPAGARA